MKFCWECGRRMLSGYGVGNYSGSASRCSGCLFPPERCMCGPVDLPVDTAYKMHTSDIEAAQMSEG